MNRKYFVSIAERHFIYCNLNIMPLEKRGKITVMFLFKIINQNSESSDIVDCIRLIIPSHFVRH